MAIKQKYVGNAKHQEPWQRGRKGSLCTTHDIKSAQQLLAAGEIQGRARFATDGERAFKGEEHSPTEWHGWPIGWKEVPETIRNRWVKNGKVQRKSIRKYWHDHEVKS